MDQKKKESVSSMLNGLAGVLILFVSFETRFSLPISMRMAKYAGFTLVFLGMFLMVWATVYIKKAITGEVAPVLDVVVKRGPYKFVRHPVYLGFVIAFFGIAVLFQSFFGLISVPLTYLPTAVYRAILEEEALAQEFGAEWKAYKEQTGFFLPI